MISSSTHKTPCTSIDLLNSEIPQLAVAREQNTIGMTFRQCERESIVHGEVRSFPQHFPRLAGPALQEDQSL